MTLNILLLEEVHASADPVLQMIPGAQIRRLRHAPDAAELKELLADVDVLGLRSRTQLDAAALAAAPRLRALGAYCTGTNNIDLKTAAERGVAIFNGPFSNTRSVAELVIGHAIHLLRRIPERQAAARRGQWLKDAKRSNEIRGKTLGIVGIGHVGTRVAALARAFGMEVLATDPLLDPAEITRRGASPVGFEELLARSDVVSLHCPRDKTTLKMMDAAAFARMKQGALFVTTARGGIHDEAALTAALRSGHLAGAGIDVWDQEPPPLDHPLLQMDNVYATFHTAGVTHEARRNMAVIAAEQILQLLAGQRPQRLINPEVWPAFQARLQSLGAGGRRPLAATA